MRSYIRSHKVFKTLSQIGSGTLSNSHQVGNIMGPIISSEILLVEWSLPLKFLFISPKILSSLHAVLVQRGYWGSCGNDFCSFQFCDFYRKIMPAVLTLLYKSILSRGVIGGGPKRKSDWFRETFSFLQYFSHQNSLCLKS